MNSFVRELGKESSVGTTELRCCLVRAESPVCLTRAPGPTSGSREAEDEEALVWPSARGGPVQE